MYIVLSFHRFMSHYTHYRPMYNYLPKNCPEYIIANYYLSIYEKKK